MIKLRENPDIVGVMFLFILCEIAFAAVITLIIRLFV